MEQLLRALADEERLTIVGYLAVNGEATQSELRQALKVPASRRGTISKHMDRLEQAHLLSRNGDAYQLRFPGLTRRAIQVVAELARETALSQAHDAEERARMLRLRTVDREEGKQRSA